MGAANAGNCRHERSWTPEQRLADMDSLGVDIHVLSPFSGFYNYELETVIAVATSKDSNDEIAQMTKTWPERFAGSGYPPDARRAGGHRRTGAGHGAARL